jgi:hypothetical protein
VKDEGRGRAKSVELLVFPLFRSTDSRQQADRQQALVAGFFENCADDAPGLVNNGVNNGPSGDDGDRTHDLRLAKPALYQLSYIPEEVPFYQARSQAKRS